MKSIHVLLLVITLVFLGACSAPSTAPTQTLSVLDTTLVAATAPEANPIATIPVAEATFTPALTSAVTRVTEATVEESPMPIAKPLTISVIYDNNAFDPRLTTAWGFSALIEYGDHTLLFDTGGDGRLLMDNMHILDVDSTQIDSVVLSHAHDDHTAGLIPLLNTGVTPVVYLLPSFPSAFKRQIEQYTQVREVSPGTSFAEGLWSTGEMGRTIAEQALVIQTEQGLVIITGCAHPGIVAIVEQAQDMFSKPVRLVIGGFHLGSQSEAEINAILANFRRLEVQQVAPCHCTGENAITMFAAEYGDDFIEIGVGSIISLDAGG